MVSIGFIYFFLPIFLGIYALVPVKARPWLMIVASAGAIALNGPMFLVPAAVCVMSAYLGGIFIYNFREKKSKSKLILILSITLSALVYLFFHHCAYDSSDLFTLLGGSSPFKTMSMLGSAVIPLNSISYLTDVYRGRYRCDHKFTTIAQFVTFFPVLAAGPLLSYEKIAESLKRPIISAELGAKGVKLFLLGLFRKLVLSNTMYELWRNVSEISPDKLPPLTAWIGILGFAFFIYFELSSFSYMASGMAAFMGVELPENFHDPYTACSVTDFLRRFNSSLYIWCRRYIRRSMISNNSSMTKVPAMCISLLLGALWYGFSYRCFVFALACMLIIIVESVISRYLKKLPIFVRRLGFVFLLLVILPVIAFNSPLKVMGYIGAMFGFNNVAVDTMSPYLAETYLLFIALCLLISSGIFSYAFHKAENISEYLSTIIQPVWCIALLVLCTAFLVSGEAGLNGYLF